MSARQKHGFLHDELGDRSFARLGLTYTLIFTGAAVVAATAGLKIPAAAWPLLQNTIGGFMLWAGGRAVARYLGPQLAGMAQAVSSAAQRYRYVPDDELPRPVPPDPE